MRCRGDTLLYEPHPDPFPIPLGDGTWRTDPLRLAIAAYLARYRGGTRRHAESDLRVYLTWCQLRGLNPLQARRPHIELYVRWMQETQHFAASTVSRRTSVVAGFYRTCVVDELLEHSPADYVRRPNVPPESPTLGLNHLQLEAMLSTARDSANPCDFALVCLLGLLGLRIFDAAPWTSPTSVRSTATASCGLSGRVTRSSSSRWPRRWGDQWTAPSATARRGRCY
ncbi:phage integrase N-terminal SAM-like domain-containing protein [Kineococcus sp. NBC_00420]|uniref:site-specific integrase n=1 Tax=Kineococcus sp. NBC_00420 TaxID=2903564 RepID=UPI002E1D9691